MAQISQVKKYLKTIQLTSEFFGEILSKHLFDNYQGWLWIFHDQMLWYLAPLFP